MAIAWATGASQFSTGNVASLDSPSLTISGAAKYIAALTASGAGAPTSASSVVLDPTGVNEALAGREAAITFNTNFECRPWYKIAPSDVTTKIVRATWASNQDETALLVDVYTGVDQTTGHRTVPTAVQTSSATPSITMTTVAADMATAMTFAGTVLGNLSTLTATSPAVLRQVVTGTSFGGFEAAATGELSASGTSTTVGFTSAVSAPFVLFGAALIPDAGGGGGGSTELPALVMAPMATPGWPRW